MKYYKRDEKLGKDDFRSFLRLRRAERVLRDDANDTDMPASQYLQDPQENYN